MSRGAGVGCSQTVHFHNRRREHVIDDDETRNVRGGLVHNSKLWCSTSALGQKRHHATSLHVCFTSESRHPSERLTSPLCAINGPQFGFEGEYCIASHTAAARKAGMTEAMFGELMAVVGMANETNRLANGYRVPVDSAFE